ncbi:S-layer homology domain-containing protein [Paenibacillus sp. J53TS2]|uniref:S-layer homology domain-containing protein n=1 Tax=Paenibacillus sp. J53TS2 TaxID=2807197 RepID=UPI001BCBD07D|nr:S-layer homology domain-containing protein [Paenibacillus sp. J53TS2]
MKKIVVVLLALIVCAQTFAPGTRSFASPIEGIVMTLSTNESEVASGEEFSYLINYSASSTIGNYTDPRISLIVPEGVTYTGKTDSSNTTSTVTDSTYFPGRKEVTFQFRNGVLPAGTTGQLVVKGKFENYVTPDSTAVTAQAVFTATENGTPVSMESNVATVTSQGSAPWSISIERTFPIPDPYKGSNVHYEIVVKPDIGNGNGLLDIRDIVVTASLDNGAVFISADNGGTLGAGNTVFWNLIDGLRDEKKLKLVVNYPGSLDATVVSLDADMTATPLGKTPVTISANYTHGFETSPVDGKTSFHLTTNDLERSPGQTITLNLSGLSNKANLPLDYGVLEFMMPTQTLQGTPTRLELQSFTSALFSGISDYDLYYTLHENPAAGDWYLWEKRDASTSNTYDATALGNIKGIQARFGNLPVEWSQKSNFVFTYLVDSDFPVPANSSETIEWKPVFYYVFNGDEKTSYNTSSTSLVNPRPLLELQNAVSQTSAVPGDTVTYTLSVKNDAQRSSKRLDNPVIYNMLPAELEYAPDSWRIVKPAGLSLDPTFTAEPQPSGETKLTWSWDDSNPGGLLIGETVNIQFNAKIKSGTAAQIVKNTFGVASRDYLNDVKYSNRKIPANTPADGIYRVEETSSMTVTPSTALQSRMWVKGELDASWTETSGTTTPGGQALYRLEIENIGNVAMKELTIVNPFPRIGDAAVLNGSIPRGSTWGPVLMGAVTAPDFVTVYYSTTSGIMMDTTTGADNGIWTASLPADPTSVTAIKMKFDPDYVIDPLNRTTLEWAMRAPVGAPTSGEIAWNSFAYHMKNVSGQSLLPAEPNKVGMKTMSSSKASIGDLVWNDVNENGLRDAGETGLNGVTVELYDEHEIKLAETITANDFSGQAGAYLFPNLDPGHYQVHFELPAGYGFAVKTAGADREIDSDADPATGKTSVFSLATGEVNQAVDAGIIKLPLNVTASAATLAPVAGADNTVTLNVYDALGNMDTNFNGARNVTISGVELAPNGSYGSFNGTKLSSASQTISVSFTNGVATPVLVLHMADEQNIGFSITGVVTPETNTLTVTPSVGSVSAMKLTQDITAPASNGGQFSQQPKVALVDAYGNIRTGDNNTPVTVVKKDTGDWTLTGTTTVTASAGVATFSDLGATNASQVTGARLAFQTDTLPEITSGAVTLPGSSPQSPPSGDNVVVPQVPSMPTRSTTEVVVLVNGKPENAGIASTTVQNGRKIMTVALNPKKLGDRLQAEGNRPVITVPFSDPSAVAIGVLNGQMIKDMEVKQGTIEIRTEKASYTLPALQIHIDAISEQIGRDVELQDIRIEIEISEPTEEQLKIVENAVNQGEYTLVLPPLNFSVRGSYDNATVDVSKFSAYVKRTLAIPDGVDPDKITTGVVIDPDGTVRHVPTIIERINGKYYATIHSLTNSIYALISNPVAFKDVAGHWSEKAVNEMGSRLVVSGIGADLYNPNQAISRAEFAAIVVRAMGLKENRGVTPFSDVRSSDWYSGAVLTALDYELISGYVDGTFRPHQQITREQAMAVVARAMEVTGLSDQLSARDSNKLLQSFDDAKQVSLWARDSVAAVLQAEIITGKGGSQLASQAFITRAEVALIIQRLLQKSELI